MSSKVDMIYRFLWDEEPTDEQLETLMKEVGEAVRQKNEAAKINFNEKMQLEMARIRGEYQKQRGHL
jgi:hypothetical protein